MVDCISSVMAIVDLRGNVMLLDDSWLVVCRDVMLVWSVRAVVGVKVLGAMIRWLDCGRVSWRVCLVVSCGLCAVVCGS